MTRPHDLLLVKNSHGRFVVHRRVCNLRNHDTPNRVSRVLWVELPNAEAFGWSVCCCVSRGGPPSLTSG